MTRWVVPGVCLLDGAADDLIDAVTELAGEQDRDERWRVGTDELAALSVAGPAVVADAAVVEVVHDPLAQRSREQARASLTGRERRRRSGSVGPDRVIKDAGQIRAVATAFLHEDQGAEPVGDEGLDDGGLVAGRLVGDAEPPGNRSPGQFLDEPQLVDLLLAIRERGDDPFHQPSGMRPARCAAGAVVLVVLGLLQATAFGQVGPLHTRRLGLVDVVLATEAGDLDEPPGQFVRPFRAFTLGKLGEGSLECGLADVLRCLRVRIPGRALAQNDQPVLVRDGREGRGPLLVRRGTECPADELGIAWLIPLHSPLPALQSATALSRSGHGDVTESPQKNFASGMGKVVSP